MESSMPGCDHDLSYASLSWCAKVYACRYGALALALATLTA